MALPFRDRRAAGRQLARHLTRYATQPEILSYIRYVADRFDLRRDIRLNTRVRSAHSKAFFIP